MVVVLALLLLLLVVVVVVVLVVAFDVTKAVVCIIQCVEWYSQKIPCCKLQRVARFFSCYLSGS